MDHPSLTAELAAMVRAFACNVPELSSIFHDPFAHYFTGHRVLKHFIANRIHYTLRGSNAFTSGMGAVGVMCALCRHKYFEELWTKSKQDGFTQLLLLGAGYDTKGIRNSSDTIFELDHPATQHRKQKIINTKKLPCSSILIPCDLSLYSADMALDNSSFNRNTPTVLIAEGLFSYLHSPRVHALLHELSLSAKTLRLVLDYRTPSMTDSKAPSDAKKWYSSFRNIGERYHSLWTPQQIEELLKATGFTVLSNKSLSLECQNRYPHVTLPESLNSTANYVYAEKT